MQNRLVATFCTFLALSIYAVLDTLQFVIANEEALTNFSSLEDGYEPQAPHYSLIDDSDESNDAKMRLFTHLLDTHDTRTKSGKFNSLLTAIKTTYTSLSLVYI